MVVRSQRAFIEGVLEAVREAKAVVLPLLMVEDPEAPLTAASLRALAAQRATLESLLGDAVALLAAFELPFLDEEERLEAEGLTLAADAAEFEVAMVAFERAFWDDRFTEYQADPERFGLRERPAYDLCAQHRLSAQVVRAAIRDHGVGDFDELAPYLGTSRACPACHQGVTRLLIQALRAAKGDRRPAPES
jgi:bacterioferritin-associated ferredoxin